MTRARGLHTPLTTTHCLPTLRPRQVLETEAKPKRWWLPAALVAYDAAFTAVYIALPEFFAFFVATFIVLCVVVFGKSIALYRCEHASELDAGLSRAKCDLAGRREEGCDGCGC